ncbi:hypothetical protein BC834DRAFT_597683 [Gloeopeniophorella convolvens]|nr:hypothetical protein BC834DRAFT_597683 [Gloeopeniophorella convolvens]
MVGKSVYCEEGPFICLRLPRGASLVPSLSVPSGYTDIPSAGCQYRLDDKLPGVHALTKGVCKNVGKSTVLSRPRLPHPGSRYRRKRNDQGSRRCRPLCEQRPGVAVPSCLLALVVAMRTTQPDTRLSDIRRAKLTRHHRNVLADDHVLSNETSSSGVTGVTVVVRVGKRAVLADPHCLGSTNTSLDKGAF